MKIEDLSIGDRARIAGYEKNIDATYRAKLLSLGVTKGCEITLTHIAPLGDPVEIELRGYRVMIRKKEFNLLVLEKM